MTEVSNSRPSCDITRYTVLSLHAEKCADDVSCVKPEVRPDIKIIDGKPEYQVLLECRFRASAFSFFCAIEGEFVFKEPISQKNVLHAWVNGCTILYGIARNLYSVSAFQCVHKELMLPAVMMIDVIKQTLEELAQKQAAQQVGRAGSATSAETR